MFGFVVAFISIIGALCWGLSSGRPRKDPLYTAIMRLGFTLHRERDYDLPRHHLLPALLETGTNHYASNVMRGVFNGSDLLAFNYHFETAAPAAPPNDIEHHHFFIITSACTDDIRPLIVNGQPTIAIHPALTRILHEWAVAGGLIGHPVVSMLSLRYLTVFCPIRAQTAPIRHTSPYPHCFSTCRGSTA